MRFGFKLPHHATTWPAIADVWRAGDQLDIFESAWTYDHLVALRPADGDIVLAPEVPMLDGWSLLAALAPQTTRLRIGNLVSCAPFRHPVVLAKMATTIDEISGGRLELGLGAGWMEPESAMYGTELGTVRDRLDRLDEALAVLVGLLTSDSFDFQGRFYQLTGARVEPKGQRPHPPIWIGGNGEKRTLRTVARWADAWNYTALRPGGALTEFRRKAGILRDRCAEIGRDPAEIIRSAQLPLRGEPRELAAEAAAWGEAGAQYVIVMLPGHSVPGDLDRLAAVLEPLRDAFSPRS